jgi:predicted metal-dependent phosphoesterase TrpH
VLIDLHAHSSASDGTDSPAGLVAEAARIGLDVVALTDHDTFAGWADALSAAEGAGIRVLPGVEMSCALDGISLHILGYLPDSTYRPLVEELARTRDDRIPRARAIVRRLAADGYPVTWDDVLAQVGPEGTVGRPHVADALVATGVVGSRDEAFAGLLHDRSRYYVRHYATDPLRAIRLLREAGGVSVFAHPAASSRGRTVPDAAIVAMAEAGLAGVEVDHPDHDAAARTHLRGVASELGLLSTGSSDYHGAGKAARLGEETTVPEVYEALLAAVREAGNARASS